jgi:hypothetical protein
VNYQIDPFGDWGLVEELRPELEVLRQRFLLLALALLARCLAH